MIVQMSLAGLVVTLSLLVAGAASAKDAEGAEAGLCKHHDKADDLKKACKGKNKNGRKCGVWAKGDTHVCRSTKAGLKEKLAPRRCAQLDARYDRAKDNAKPAFDAARCAATRRADGKQCKVFERGEKKPICRIEGWKPASKASPNRKAGPEGKKASKGGKADPSGKGKAPVKRKDTSLKVDAPDRK